MINPRLKQALQNDAGAAPPFCPFLHEKIMAPIRAAQTPHRAPSRTLRWHYALPIAAALALAPALLWMLRPSQPIPTSTPAQPAIAIPSSHDISDPVDRLLAAAATPATTTLNDSKYAYLDQDAHHLVLYLADQLPTPPTAK